LPSSFALNMQSLRTCCHSRPLSIIPPLRRSLTIKLPSLRTPERVPLPNDKIKTPTDFLRAIGRSSETKLASEDWAEFWNASGRTMKGKGVGVQDRRSGSPFLEHSNSKECFWVDIYYGACRDTARTSRLEILRMTQNRRRRFEGEQTKWLSIGNSAQIFSIRRGPSVQNGKKVRR
jgi:hypothetical protein